MKMKHKLLLGFGMVMVVLVSGCLEGGDTWSESTEQHDSQEEIGDVSLNAREIEAKSLEDTNLLYLCDIDGYYQYRVERGEPNLLKRGVCYSNGDFEQYDYYQTTDEYIKKIGAFTAKESTNTYDNLRFIDVKFMDSDECNVTSSIVFYNPEIIYSCIERRLNDSRINDACEKCESLECIKVACLNNCLDLARKRDHLKAEVLCYSTCKKINEQYCELCITKPEFDKWDECWWAGDCPIGVIIYYIRDINKTFEQTITMCDEEEYETEFIDWKLEEYGYNVSDYGYKVNLGENLSLCISGW